MINKIYILIIYNMGNKPSTTNELAEQVNRSNARIKKDFDDSINKTARVIDRTNKTIDTGFNQEISKPMNRTFNKANMEKFDDQLVKGLKDTGRVLGKAGEIGDKILNNPITQIASTIPVVGQVVGGLRLANTGLKAGGALTSGVGGIADRKQYEGKSGVNVATNVLEKSIKTGENVAGSGITFH
jgi:predicted transcriptional regulator